MEIGVHQYYTADLLERPMARSFSALDMSGQQVLNAIIIDYVYRMGVDPRFASIAAATPPSEIYYFTNAELERLGVNFRPGEFLRWVIEPYEGGVVARSRSRDGNATVSVFCRRDRIPRVQIADGDYDARGLMEAVGAIFGIVVFGVDLPPHAVRVVSVGGRPALQITVSGLNPEHLGGMTIRADVGRVSAWYFAYDLPDAIASETIGIALRNCGR